MSELQHPLLLLIEDLHFGKAQTKAFRIRRFCEFQKCNGQEWYEPDLREYRDHLLIKESLSLSSVRPYLSTVRTAYRELVSAPQYEYLFSPPDLRNQLTKALHPAAAPIVSNQNSQLGRILTRHIMELLLVTPGTNTLIGMRDTTIIALMLCTGISAFELVNLNVTDLVVDAQGTARLWIQNDKAPSTHRVIPSEPFVWGMDLTLRWLNYCGITIGPIFPPLPEVAPFTDITLPSVRLHSSAILSMLSRYPIMIDDERIVIKPRDLRRTYAYKLFSIGISLEEIQVRLGWQSLLKVKMLLGLI